MRVDLHIHSTASDGCWPPEQLVQEVKQAGIDLFAVADHDTTGSVYAVEAAARGSGLGFIRAVEISNTLCDNMLHILGYGVDVDAPDLQRVLSENRDVMESIDRQSIDKLIAAGYSISHAEYEAYVHEPTRGGWKALSLFIDRGFCTNVGDFYNRLFSGDMALTYPTFCPSEQVIAIIHHAGGTAICAHPGYSVRSDRDGLLGRLVAAGLDGLECYSPYHKPETTAEFIAYCREHKLLITAGSDCHGGFVDRPLGRPAAIETDLNLGPLLDYILY